MKKAISLTLATVLLAGCLVGWDNQTPSLGLSKDVLPTSLPYTMDVQPETFYLNVSAKGRTETVSEGQKPMKVAGYQKSEKGVSWTYPELQQSVQILKKDNYMDVQIKYVGDAASAFTWPKVQGSAYLLPLGEGKYIPSTDHLWRDYLKESELKGLEALSMQFLGVEKSSFGLVYIIDNPYNNTLTFDGTKSFGFSIKHETPTVAKDKTFGYRVYVTPNDTVQMAKTYKQYLIENKRFKTLAEKAVDNPNVEKLYGAAHVYLWDRTVISEENIHWSKLRTALAAPVRDWIKSLLETQVEGGKELAGGFDDLVKNDYVDGFTKKRVISGLSAVLQLKTFYNPAVFTANPAKSINTKSNNSKSHELLAKITDGLNSVELIQLNKALLKDALGDSVDPVEQWSNARTTDLLSSFKNAGLDHLWLGFDDWKEGFLKPEMVAKANDMGYLMGTYDSYHSIHEPGKEKWETAKFKDATLYEKATVTNQRGKKITGFQGVGRKLNPTLALAAVEDRVGEVMGTGLSFNSWFLDTDGTGEVYDDYSPKHRTSESEDIEARLKRMKFLQKQWHMVIGTEGGNTFVSSTAAFAHGIETPCFTWMDPDMQKNKDSVYYMGKYYSSTNGVPEMFSKQIPLKDHWRQLFLSEKYSIPLYKLVYNDAFITTHWWGLGTLKFKDDVTQRMMTEVLYNVPPMYHLDQQEWKKHQKQIVNHTKIWSEFSKQAILQPMTDYKVLTPDRKVQMTAYGEKLKCVANYGDRSFKYDKMVVPAFSVLLFEGGKVKIYTPH